MTNKCCANCIGDRYLRAEVIPLNSVEVGTCSYCHSDGQKLIEPKVLQNYFDLLLGIYVKDNSGKSIVNLLKNDWHLFQHPEMSDANSQVLLSDILDDGNIVRENFSPSSVCHSNSLAQWGEFRKELMHKNRFFPQMSIERDRLKELLEYLLLDEIEIPNIMYRARLQAGDIKYSIGEMGAPPIHLASHGRANPAGIPYLYIASDIQTAISEIRPHTGEKASVAELQLIDGLILIDLRNPRSTVSPFMLADADDVAALMGDISFLEHLGDELTRPVLPSAAAFDYVPSQYLCEFAKNCGYQGVMYRSSVGDGQNIALFNPDHAVIKSVGEHLVERVSVVTNDIS